MADWNRKPNEPHRWFGRFDRYFRPQGKGRTVEEAWRQWREIEGKRAKAKVAPQQWRDEAKKWKWEEPQPLQSNTAKIPKAEKP